MISMMVACVLIGVTSACGGDDGDASTSDAKGAPCSVKGKITKGNKVTSLDHADGDVETAELEGDMHVQWRRYTYSTQVWNDSIDRGYKITIVGVLSDEDPGPDVARPPDSGSMTEYDDHGVFDGEDGVVGPGLQASGDGTWEIHGKGGADISTDFFQRNYPVNRADVDVSFHC
jgi:hypothetical protein